MYKSVYDCNLCNIKQRKSNFSAIIIIILNGILIK